MINKRTLCRLISVLAALVMGLSLLIGCSTKSTEQAQEQEDAQTIQVYLWTNSLYETYAPYIQSQLPDVNVEFIVGNNSLDFYKFLQQNGGLPDIITCCRFSLHDAAPLKNSLMNLATTNAAGAVYRQCAAGRLYQEDGHFHDYAEQFDVPSAHDDRCRTKVNRPRLCGRLRGRVCAVQSWFSAGGQRHYRGGKRG